MTKYPVKEFVRQQLIEFENTVNQTVYLIHDHGSQFFFRYCDYHIKGVKTSIMSPNMNAIAERFVKSIRVEALDHIILYNENQIRNILKLYFKYYNNLRPHQGRNQEIPCGGDVIKFGKIKKEPILGGLHHHYYRQTA